LLIFDLHRKNNRKLRLFACACVDHIQNDETDDRFIRAVRVAERMADGYAVEVERRSALDAVDSTFTELNPELLSRVEHTIVAARYALNGSALLSFAAANRAASSLGDGKSAEQFFQTSLIRDIFGNPFRPIVADPAWLTPTVVGIATSLYEDRAFDRLPILADALEEAGCTNADLLLHCRQPGEHVRGCWAVDLVLGKA
jgi:hypothetical protein